MTLDLRGEKLVGRLIRMFLHWHYSSTQRSVSTLVVITEEYFGTTNDQPAG